MLDSAESAADTGLELVPLAWRAMVLPRALQAAGTGRLSDPLQALLRRQLGGDEVLMEEAEQFLLARLPRRLVKAQAVSQSFLSVTVARLLQDFMDHRFGTNRPPLAIQRAGGAWLDTFKRLCQMGWAPADVAHWLVDHYSVSLEDARLIVRETREMAVRTGCAPQFSRQPQSLDRAMRQDSGGDSLLDQVASDDPDPTAALEDEDVRVFLSALVERLHFSREDIESAHAMARVDPKADPVARLCVRMHLIDGLAFAAIGRELALDAKRVERLVKSLLADWRQQAELAGLVS